MQFVFSVSPALLRISSTMGRQSLVQRALCDWGFPVCVLGIHLVD